jgi:hypothetical protein
MNEGYYGNSTKLNNINRKKRKEGSENWKREPAGEKGERRRKERGKDKENRRELEKISLKVRFRF